MYGMMYSSDKMMMNPKPLCPPPTNCFTGRYSPTYRVPEQMRDPMRRCMTNPPSEIFGSLNEGGLLSRASAEALVAVDMKHPVSAAVTGGTVFPQIKSDMMYTHPSMSSAGSLNARGHQIDHSGMMDMLNSPHGGGLDQHGGAMSSPGGGGTSGMSGDPSTTGNHHHQLSSHHTGMYGHSASMMSAHTALPHGHPPHGHPVSLQDTDTDPRELEAFAERFKQRRIKLGVTQCDVGKALASLKLPGVGALSQSTICRFESLTLSHNNMIALKPVLSAWLDEAEAAKRDPDGCGGVLPPGEKKRKRTSIAAPEKRSLEAYFAVQPRPSGEKIAAIAEKLDLKKNVVRVWFCNQRQKQKRMKFAAQGGSGGGGL
ncbi:POU domain, class 4, transcription factor 3 isoform X2 [Lepeophtheirus salmonis]|nr:inhibitory POU protein-like isoform X2 [Lepeophtheirus salmonis]